MFKRIVYRLHNAENIKCLARWNNNIFFDLLVDVDIDTGVTGLQLSGVILNLSLNPVMVIFSFI